MTVDIIATNVDRKIRTALSELRNTVIQPIIVGRLNRRSHSLPEMFIKWPYY